ncbi:MAG: 2-C-methyl-D-erythritol 2,4-cyclodiphosphate synthase [Deltaproteobacteria bacterium]|nr:2-C-methyl-D-erythritol 2,4-cyclodiphosphate synthase [Deltaproteobacteria bacterium]
MRIGHGYDVHRLEPGGKLILGGVEIPHTHGLAGHSDADVLLHAVCDALLGAAGLGDIGEHFPDTDEQYRGVSSMKLLEKTTALLEKQGFAVVNVDATLVAEKPKISPHKDAMRANIARVLGVDPGVVNVKATTTEGLGIAGRGEGMAALCTALIHRPGPGRAKSSEAG